MVGAQPPTSLFCDLGDLPDPHFHLCGGRWKRQKLKSQSNWYLSLVQWFVSYISLFWTRVQIWGDEEGVVDILKWTSNFNFTWIVLIPSVIEFAFASICNITLDGDCLWHWILLWLGVERVVFLSSRLLVLCWGWLNLVRVIEGVALQSTLTWEISTGDKSIFECFHPQKSGSFRACNEVKDVDYLPMAKPDSN